MANSGNHSAILSIQRDKRIVIPRISRLMIQLFHRLKSREELNINGNFSSIYGGFLNRVLNRLYVWQVFRVHGRIKKKV